jgi:uncharacterized protein (TIGR01777 family)
MNAVFIVLSVQAVLGAFDNLWHHELRARLPQRVSARHELALHSARECIYGLLYLGLAWFEWHGAWALLLAGLLLVEFVITCADFLEEDRSRALEPFERVLHTILAASYGVLLGVFAPVLLGWLAQPFDVVAAHHGLWSVFFSIAGVGVLAWSLRNALAVRRWALQADAAPAVAAQPAARRGDAAVLVTGGTGFVGTALVRALLGEGRRVIVLTRDVRQARALFDHRVWAVDRLDDIPAETRVDAVVHLAGASVMGLPWTQARRTTLVESRTKIMQSLLTWMRGLETRPHVLVSASAVGYYGLHHAGPVDERSAAEPGRFQSDLCIAAEHEAERACGLGVRVVRLRLGLVLGRDGGVLPALALAARCGLGARIGHGRQPMPWVHIDDATALIRFAMANPALRGAVNAVAPQVPMQSAFIRALAARHGRKAWLRVPAGVLRAAMGEMSQLLTDGQKAQPIAALRAGFRFAHPDVDGAFDALFAPSAGSGPAHPPLAARITGGDPS